MGYRGKVHEQERAREQRAQAWTLLEIANELGVSKSSVSLWVRDVDFEPRPRRYAARRQRPSKSRLAKQTEIEEMLAWGRERMGRLSDEAFLAAGAIIQSRGNVQGLTTGANMWLAGALGVACGAGDYVLAGLGTVFALIVLVVLGRLEQAARKDPPK